jgi:SP family myo-inositol transporter-like MFS transporter 13
MITLGQVIAYGIGAGFENVHGGWRWMVGLGAIPAGIQFFLLYFLPESRPSHFPARDCLLAH